MKYDFITLGGAVEDITIFTSEALVIDNKKDILRQKLMAFEYGAKLQVDHAFSTFGGGAANAAVNLAGLGFSVASFVALGDDIRAQAVLDNFQKKNVDTRLIQRIKNCDTGFSFLVAASDSEHVAFSNRAASSQLSIGTQDLKSLKNTDWIYITSLSGKWRDILKKAFSLGVKIAWNPGQTQLDAGFGSLRNYLKKTTVFSLNKDEAIQLVISNSNYKDKDNRFLNNVRNLLKVIKSFGPKIVVVTNGKHGADAYDGETFYHQDILKEKKRVDTTGVGDAFASTFVAGLNIFDGDIQRSMLAGCRQTASVIGEQGAQNGLLKKSGI